MHYNPRWRPACFASSLRPISLISKSWKGTKYQQTWSTTTPNDKNNPSHEFFLSIWWPKTWKCLALKKKKKKKSADFPRFFLIDRRSEIIRRSPPIRIGIGVRSNDLLQGYPPAVCWMILWIQQRHTAASAAASYSCMWSNCNIPWRISFKFCMEMCLSKIYIY